MIINYDYFAGIYGSCTVDRNTFDRLNYDAERYLIKYTTGISGFEKLIEAFPTNERDVEAIKRTACKLVVVLNDIEKARASEQEIAGVIIREDGTVMPRRVSSISSGSESITFASGSSANQANSAVFSESAKMSYIADVIRDGLSGVHDKNGVNLLYMG